MHIGNHLEDLAEHLAVFPGNGKARRIGKIHRCGAGVDGGFNDLRQVMNVGSCGILGGKLDRIRILARELHRFHRPSKYLITGHMELMLQVNIGGGDKDVNARPFGGANGFRTGFDIAFDAARQPADFRGVAGATYGLCDILDRLQVSQ